MDWNERYSEPGFTYGTSPNEFLVSVADGIPKGKILSLAEGKGEKRRVSGIVGISGDRS